jgi:hypothetical protein
MTASNQSHKIVRAALVIGAAATIAAACGGGSGVTAQQACAELAKNVCAKFQTCPPVFVGPNDSACEPSNQALCLDSVRAPHSGYTPSVVSACAAGIGAATCDDFYSTNPAACNPHGGTIQIGGACGDAWQCASGLCFSTTPGPCAICVEPVAKGGACDELGVPCASGLICGRDETGQNSCQSRDVPLGGTCFWDVCPGGAYCKLGSSSPTQGICSPLPEAGQPCDPVLQICANDVECNPSTMICQSTGGTVQPGAACGWIAGQYIACVGSNCLPNQSGDGSTCTAVTQAVSEGQACGADGGTCASGFQCIGGVCTDPGPTTCGGSGPPPEAGAPDTATSTPPFDIWDGGLADASLADTINVEACATVDVSVDAASGVPLLFPPACSACCTNAGYQSAAINDGRCICVVYPQGREGTACAQAIASIGVCGACCNDAGFNGSLQGPSGDAGDICTCLGIQDTVTCASAAEDPNPIAACDLCCVRNSYANYIYGSLGAAAGTCTCQSP